MFGGGNSMREPGERREGLLIFMTIRACRMLKPTATVDVEKDTEPDLARQ